MAKWIKIKCKENYKLEAGKCYCVTFDGEIFEDLGLR